MSKHWARIYKAAMKTYQPTSITGALQPLVLVVITAIISFAFGFWCDKHLQRQEWGMMEVRQMQEFLLENGYIITDIDGIAGREFCLAVNKYSIDREMTRAYQ